MDHLAHIYYKPKNKILVVSGLLCPVALAKDRRFLPVVILDPLPCRIDLIEMNLTKCKRLFLFHQHWK